MPIDHIVAEKHFAAYEGTGSAGRGMTTWLGVIENCDVCSRPMRSETYMIDGPAQSFADTMWGNLCVICAFKTSPIIGWGQAQLYKQQEGRWHLIAGGPPPVNEYGV